LGAISASVNTKSQLKQINIDKANSNSSVSISNKGKGTLYVRLIRSGIPSAGQETAKQSNLQMNVTYKTVKGDIIDVSQLEQGTDFIAEVTVYHPGIKPTYRNMALTQIFPSGWEIHNSRMDENVSASTKSDIPTYQDIRDDRVYTYFDVNQAGNRTYRVMLNAAYTGRFYLPTCYTEAMYDNNVNARIPGKWIEVVNQGVSQ
ncbi:MAG TPA: hypothetical protein VNX68_00010, partial [Nitrosopumilaceae archaeon]|nr:hypothetical protein [Nitrosopumilaceae archaeon]